MNEQKPAGRSGRRGRQARETSAPAHEVNYRNLRNPFPLMKLYSDDAIEAMHEAALTALEDLGMKILLGRGLGVADASRDGLTIEEAAARSRPSSGA